MSSLAANIIENLLNHKVGDDSSALSIKDTERVDQTRSKHNVLKQLAYMQSFQEMSEWVEINSNGKKFIANPSNATDTDREQCLTYIQKALKLALQNLSKRRKNGRDVAIIKASIVSDYFTIASILASSARTYWLDRGFFLVNSQQSIFEKFHQQSSNYNDQKWNSYRAQIVYIGAIVSFEKAQKIGVLQEILDFEETEVFLKYNDFEIDHE